MAERRVQGKVVMRLAPYPSGPLHIGNTKTYVSNDYYVKHYGGKLLLVMDDTIGSEEKNISKEAYDMIPEGLKWLDVEFDDTIVYKSDRLEIYYEYAEELIRKDKAYVCLCKPEALRENRKKGIVCNCRAASIEITLDKWKEMFDKYKEGEAVLRIRTSMEHPNPAFRDRVLFRISNREHPKVGKKYKVWPLLDFAWAIDDHLLGITHVLRGKDLMMESEMENYIWDIFGWKKPVLIHTALVQLEGVKISKSKSSKEVKSGLFSGWSDPRTWSLQSLKRRGFLPAAIRNFSLSLGVNQNEITVPIESLYAENRKLIDSVARRYFFVENPEKLMVKKAPKMEVELNLHPDMQKGGRHFKTGSTFFISGGEKLLKGKIYRFMNLFNFQNSEFVSEQHDAKLKAKMIHWLPADSDNIKVEILMPDGKWKKGLAEHAVMNLKEGDVVQFERFGFCRLDKKDKNKLAFWYTHK
jgi:glutamyl-tRNA synthetase